MITRRVCVFPHDTPEYSRRLRTLARRPSPGPECVRARRRDVNTRRARKKRPRKENDLTPQRRAGYCWAPCCSPHDHPPAGDRPGLPAAQAPRQGAVVRAWPSARAHVFYPEATDERCTAALLLEVDPVALVRGRRRRRRGSRSAQYVNDRPYAAVVDARRRARRGVPHRDARRCSRAAGAGRPAAPAGDPRPGAACRGGADLVRAALRAARLGRSRRRRSPLDPDVPGVGRLAATSTCG